ncbi:unnamed protein product [Gadus morhua 'NCC']
MKSIPLYNENSSGVSIRRQRTNELPDHCGGGRDPDQGAEPEEGCSPAKVASLEALKARGPTWGYRGLGGNYLVRLGTLEHWEHWEATTCETGNTGTLGGQLLKRDSPDTASSLALVSGELQRKDKFMRVLFSCNVRKGGPAHLCQLVLTVGSPPPYLCLSLIP